MIREYPYWIKKRLPEKEKRMLVEKTISDLNLNTVCQSADCPNFGECFENNTATFMILGNICTRNCKFCSIRSGIPEQTDPCEAMNVAIAVNKLKLDHVVITSVSRDDLEDGGVSHFINTVREINHLSSNVRIELLTPDFNGKQVLLEKLARSNFDVFNHNIETIPSFYDIVRPDADYNCSLKVLETMKKLKPSVYTKSSLMVGLGEKKSEVIKVMKDLYDVKVDFLTIGQYLRPSKKHLQIKEFVTPELFSEYKKIAEKIGFKGVISEPLSRSSFKAGELYLNMSYGLANKTS